MNWRAWTQIDHASKAYLHDRRLKPRSELWKLWYWIPFLFVVLYLAWVTPT